MHWLPPNGALHGDDLDRLLNVNLDIVFWLFVAAQILLVLALVLAILRRRSPNAVPSAPQPNRTFLVVDYVSIAAFAALYLWMLISGHHLWAARREAARPANAVKVEVTGVQFQWYFRYPGPDGRYGRTVARLVSAPTGNPLGLDPDDPSGRDDIVSGMLVLPAGRTVDLMLRSLDVIHGFFIPGMRLKEDAVPGITGHLQFTPITPGDYPILCSQVCGLGHARMQSRLRVLPAAEYDRWLAAREQTVQRNSAALDAPPTRTP
jgi:cytochrome c oxidase subunit 2